MVVLVEQVLLVRLAVLVELAVQHRLLALLGQVDQAAAVVVALLRLGKATK
jgi:hypothetical protein